MFQGKRNSYTIFVVVDSNCISEQLAMFSIAICLVQIIIALKIESTNGLILRKLIDQNCSDILNISLQNAPPQMNVGDMFKCPPWFQLDNQTGACHSGPQLGGIVQQDMLTLQTSLLECNCMTSEDGALFVGACLYTCNAIKGYFPLPCHISELEDFMCADLNRRGYLCGQCIENYSLPVYSYEMKCVKCEDYKYNWLKYLAVAFLPLTIFYLLVTLLSISFTSPLLSAVVVGCQIAANPTQLQILLHGIESGSIIVPKQAVVVTASLAGFWNLDFFRMAYNSFCLHPNASAMEIMALDYVTAVYPILLIIVTYGVVTLYDQQHFHLLSCGQKLCGSIHKLLRIQWNIRTSLVKVFASFIFLSSSRLLLASMNFLVPIKIHTYPQNSDKHIQLSVGWYLLNAPTVEYFGKKHLPFALLAITLSFLLFILPMILLFVYPFRWFQHLLNKFRINSLILRTFMDVFQGPFKDGTNGTKDYRYFSGFLLLLSLVLNLTFSQTLSSFYYPMATISILIYLILHLAFLPYKQQIHNYITIVILSCLLSAYWGCIINMEAVSMTPLPSEFGGTTEGFLVVSIILMMGSISIALLYVIGLLCYLTTRRVCSRKKTVWT